MAAYSRGPNSPLTTVAPYRAKETKLTVTTNNENGLMGSALVKNHRKHPVFKGFSPIVDDGESSDRSEVPIKKETHNMQSLLDAEDWGALLKLLEKNPSLSLINVAMRCQGERTQCLVLHAVVARRAPCLSLVEAIGAMNPSALYMEDCRGRRLPLHMALLKGVASIEIVRHLCHLHPAALLHQDRQGNTPLHYACQVSPESICDFLLEKCPEACRRTNEKGRLALLVLCARGWDANEAVSLGLVERLLELYPASVTIVDRNSTPLGLRQNPSPRGYRALAHGSPFYCPARQGLRQAKASCPGQAISTGTPRSECFVGLVVRTNETRTTQADVSGKILHN
jgi:hypothetical protein